MSRGWIGVVVVVALAAGLVVGGCGGSDSNAPPPPSTGNLMCPTGTSCTPAEIQSYGECLSNACDAEYKACFGPDYMSGQFSGVCGTVYGCYARCACNDTACRTRCGVPDATCQLCLANNFAGCMNSCTPPACTGATNPDAGGFYTCADLMRCCGLLTDATQKMVCNIYYQQASPNGNAICSPFYQSFKIQGLCP